MKTVILAGGLGTRLSEETVLRPKPMVEVGGKPILWHILNIYAAHNFTEFIIALGYKAEFVKEYFLNFYALNNDLTVDLAAGQTKVHDGKQPNWKIHLKDTGLHTMTGGRIKRLRDWIGDETFMVTYGDGLANVDIGKLVEFHKAHGKLATLTAVRPPARFGGLRFEGDRIAEFLEKPQTGEGWINGGFFVLEPGVFDYIADDTISWEREPLEAIANAGQLMAFRHEGFFQPMDTIREKTMLDKMWNSGNAPWKVWGDQS
ncbi:MAG: glucose-1-phosphate cytidylyltransferase [Sumerlaeia bacterium]